MDENMDFVAALPPVALNEITQSDLVFRDLSAEVFTVDGTTHVVVAASRWSVPAATTYDFVIVHSEFSSTSMGSVQ